MILIFLPTFRSLNSSNGRAERKKSVSAENAITGQPLLILRIRILAPLRYSQADLSWLDPTSSGYRLIPSFLRWITLGVEKNDNRCVKSKNQDCCHIAHPPQPPFMRPMEDPNVGETDG